MDFFYKKTTNENLVSRFWVNYLYDVTLMLIYVLHKISANIEIIALIIQSKCGNVQMKFINIHIINISNPTDNS